MRIGVVVFDVGETLVDEGRLWDGWADYLSVPRDVSLRPARSPSGSGIATQQRPIAAASAYGKSARQGLMLGA